MDRGVRSMNPEQQRFQQMLEDAGLGDMSKYFTGDVSKLVGLFGFDKGKQTEQFGKFFKGFDPGTYLEAADKASERLGERTRNLGTKFSENIENISNQFGAGKEKLTQEGAKSLSGISSMIAKSGFTGFGGAEKERRRARLGRRDSLKDLLDKVSFRKGAYERQYGEGMVGAEKEYGTSRGAIFAELQRYLDSLFGRAENIYGLDPGTTVTKGDPGVNYVTPEGEDEDWIPGGDV